MHYLLGSLNFRHRLQQMKVVDAFISSHPNTKILWLKIEPDPTKIEGISVEKH